MPARRNVILGATAAAIYRWKFGWPCGRSIFDSYKGMHAKGVVLDNEPVI